MNDLDWFESLPLDDMVVVYGALVYEEGNPIHEQYNLYAEQIYGRFFEMLNESIRNKFRNIFQEMNLETTWRFTYDRELTSKTASMAVIYSMNENGTSDYDPLIEFIIPLDENRLNSVYLAIVFKKLAKNLEECLQRTFTNWSAAMANYYLGLHGRFQECLAGKDFDAPTDDPERFFLTHQMVILD